MYSFVIKIAIDVKRAVEVVKTIPMLEFIIDNVEVVIADPDLNKISMISNNAFLIEDSYFFLSYSLSSFSDLNIFS